MLLLNEINSLNCQYLKLILGLVQWILDPGSFWQINDDAAGTQLKEKFYIGSCFGSSLY